MANPRIEKMKRIERMTQQLVEAHGTGVLVTKNRRVPITDRATILAYNHQRNSAAQSIGEPALGHREYIEMAQATGMKILDTVYAAVGSTVVNCQPGKYHKRMDPKNEETVKVVDRTALALQIGTNGPYVPLTHHKANGQRNNGYRRS